MNAWLCLMIAIVADVTGLTALKMSDGFTRVVPSAVVVVSYALFFWGFSQALKKIDLTTVYPIWVALGTVAMTCVGVFLFKEAVTIEKLGFTALILVGVAGLYWTARV